MPTEAIPAGHEPTEAGLTNSGPTGPNAVGTLAIPLAQQAQGWLSDLAQATHSPAIAALSPAQLLGERASLGGFAVPGMVAAGGGCRLYRAVDGWVALNLARPDDIALLPAMFGDADLAADTAPTAAIIAAHIARHKAAPLVAQGRELGMAIARTGEAPRPAVTQLAEGIRQAPPTAAPLVLDLSALWAGPLAGHLLWLAGARVVKVESPRRPDTMRHGDAALFARLNQGKANVAIDPTTAPGRSALLRLIAQADIVIEATRPRALAQLGVDAGALVRERTDKPLLWLTLTGHGADGEAANWVGFGDDCGVAGGLADALIAATGAPGFVGDAIGDPLTGIRAAREAWRAWARGQSCRIGLAMSGVVAEALASERTQAPTRLAADLAAWGKAAGQSFPPIQPRVLTAPVAALGADTAAWLGTRSSC